MLRHGLLAILIKSHSLDQNALLHMHLEFCHDELVVRVEISLADVRYLGNRRIETVLE